MEAKFGNVKLPGEDDNHCCWFIPIRTGVVIIGIFMILHALQMVSFAVDFVTVAPIYGILYAIATLPILVGGYLFIQYFMDREATDGKKGTVTACYLVILSYAIVLVIQVATCVVGDGSFNTLVASIVNSVCAVIWNYYMACVCRRL